MRWWLRWGRVEVVFKFNTIKDYIRKREKREKNYIENGKKKIFLYVQRD